MSRGGRWRAIRTSAVSANEAVGAASSSERRPRTARQAGKSTLVADLSASDYPARFANLDDGATTTQPEQIQQASSPVSPSRRWSMRSGLAGQRPDRRRQTTRCIRAVLPSRLPNPKRQSGTAVDRAGAMGVGPSLGTASRFADSGRRQTLSSRDAMRTGVSDGTTCSFDRPVACPTRSQNCS
jgi:hypothetical protein